LLTEKQVNFRYLSRFRTEYTRSWTSNFPLPLLQDYENSRIKDDSKSAEIL